MATKEKSSVIYLITDKICDIMKDSHEMDKKVDKSLGEALAYMRNLPKIYIKELELNRSSFLHILGNLSHFFYDNKSDASASRLYVIRV